MKVSVKTPARLHFGLIDLNGDLGRIFGGLGLGIDFPNVIIHAEQSQESRFTGKKTELTQKLTERFLQTYNLQGLKVHIHVEKIISDHVGLGSGTQMALAVATALSKLFKVEASTPELAVTMGRAQRTGVGTAVFEQGGFVVDGGKLVSGGTRFSFPPLIYRRPFPEDWQFVVAVPNAIKGKANNDEETAFQQTPPMSSDQVGKICRLIVMKLLPALTDLDIKGFGEALTHIQAAIGDNFASVQGGRYSSESTRRGIEFMQGLGACGVGQSSWGPALYGLFSKEHAQSAQLQVQNFMERENGGEVFVAKANNRGAYIRVGKS